MTTAIAKFYATYRAAYDAAPFCAENYTWLAKAENALAATPAECVGDMLLKLKVATEQGPGCDIFPVMVASVVRDLERMNKRPLAIAA